ncbi:hypothetical protein FRC00_008795 [Tulasnella sp. 408]|nr:hypothetical protein FRC00_008795 [Tulasnella sp. 408]
MCGRILGYMMLEAPTSVGCDNVQKEIALCETDEALRNLAQLYAAYFLRLSKKAKGHTPGSSSHSSRPSFDDTKEAIMLLMEEAQKSNSVLKRLALERDNYRCVVTGAYDLAIFREQHDTNPTLEQPTAIRITQTAHIFPDSLNQNLVGSGDLLGKKAVYSAPAWAVVERFGLINVLTESLNGPSIHRVENVLTMSLDVRELFGTLQLWFEATDVPNTYKLCSTDDIIFTLFNPPIPRQVTLESTNSSIPLPNSDYLKIHGACAKVAHLSGATEYLKAILNEWEERPVLASDGGSADMLSFLLARVLVAGH